MNKIIPQYPTPLVHNIFADTFRPSISTNPLIIDVHGTVHQTMHMEPKSLNNPMINNPNLPTSSNIILQA